MRSPAPRPAREEDLEAAAAVARARSATGWGEAALRGELGRADSILLVADGEGYAAARLVDGECRLLDLAVREDGRGVGRALVAALAAEARRRGAARLTLEVSERNARARRLYEAAGARVVGRRPKFYNDGADAVLMDLAL